MRLLTTVLCAVIFCAAGISLAITENNSAQFEKANALHAATVPTYTIPKLSYNLQSNLENEYTKRDTVYVPQELVVVTDRKASKSLTKSRSAHTRKSTPTRRQNLRSPAAEPDTVVKKLVCGDREEYTPDTIGPSKESIILIVDGEEVYKR